MVPFPSNPVLPTLVPRMEYKGQDIRDRGMASVAYAEMRRPETMSYSHDYLRKGLRKYHERDNKTEVRLYKVLMEG